MAFVQITLSALEENFFAQQLASVTNSMVPNLIPKPSCKASQYKKKTSLKTNIDCKKKQKKNHATFLQ